MPSSVASPCRQRCFDGGEPVIGSAKLFQNPRMTVHAAAMGEAGFRFDALSDKRRQGIAVRGVQPISDRKLPWMIFQFGRRTLLNTCRRC
jgi:hypothetical protein